MKLKRRFNWPFLEFYLAIPFIRIQTAVMREPHDMYAYEYIGMRVEIWKWKWQFRLYRPGRKG